MSSAVAAGWAVLAGALVIGRGRRIAGLPRVEPPARPPRGTVPLRRRRGDDGIADALPDLIDLFVVAVAAGLNPLLAVRAVASRAPAGPITDALRRVDEDVAETGARLADVLERLPAELESDLIRPLVGALTDADRYGTALVPALDRLADDARRSRHRRAEEAARRIPVKLLFPLVTCILPAFGLLTVAPLIAGGLRALRL